ncbi:MAG TPA: hypothetical protein VF365_01120 [Candidatus Limnocylindria bacterium]
MKRTVPGLFVALLVLSACAAGGGSPPASADSGGSPGASDEPAPSASPRDSDGGGTGGDVEHPTGSEAIVVVTLAGGMIPAQMQVGEVPVFTLVGDGRVIVPGLQTLEFPGPILPALQERRLTEEGIQLVLSALDETNLFTGDLENRVAASVISDASDTVFTVHAGGRTSVVTVFGVGMMPPEMEPPPGTDEGELEAYRVLSALNDRLMTLDTWLPADAWATDTWQEYQPEAFRLYVRDVTDQPDDEELPGQQIAWPADEDPATFGEEMAHFGDGTRCGVVEGEAGATWLDAFLEANQNTIWTFGDRRYAIDPRPLLPHEEAICPPLNP